MNHQLDVLRVRGFDQSRVTGRTITVRCGECQAVVINNVATHEMGCPNTTRTCKGCNNVVIGRARYCEECQ